MRTYGYNMNWLESRLEGFDLEKEQVPERQPRQEIQETEESQSESESGEEREEAQPEPGAR